MRKMKLTACAGILLGFVSTCAMADYGSPYGAGKFGWTQEKASSIENTAVSGDTTSAPTKNNMQKSTYLYGGALGYQYNGFIAPIRFEGEYLYRATIDHNSDPILVGGTSSMKTNLYTQTIMGNLYLDIPITDMFLFFVGGGGGLANTRTHTTRTASTVVTKNETDRDAVTWMATAGMTIKPADWFALEASYRYSNLGSVRWSVGDIELTSNNFTANEVLVGFRLTAPGSAKPKPVQRYQASEYSPPAVKEQNYPQDNSNERARRQKAAGDTKADK